MSEPLIIAQPRVAGRPPLSVAAVRFQGPFRGRVRPQVSLVVKLAFSFAPGPDGQLEGPLALVDAPRFERDRPSELPGAARGEIAYPSDFVPQKRAVDVLLTGHAYAERPWPRIDASVTLAPTPLPGYPEIEASGLRRAFCLVAGAPAARLPLSSSYLRAEDGVSPTEPVGPRSAGEVLEDHGPAFDFARYGSAAEAQRIPLLVPGASIELAGLSPRAPRRTIEVPKVELRAVIVSRFGPETGVALPCDTLWIDTDAERLVLVFRGSVPLSDGSTESVDRVDVWLDDTSEPRRVSDVRRDLQRGIFAYAVEPGDLDAGEPRAPSSARVAQIKYGLWHHSPEPSILLEQYARISAELSEKREPRDVTLRRHDLDEDRWGVEERAWLETFGAGAMRGDVSATTRYGELFMAAQDALAAPHEVARTIDDYVAVRAAMDQGAETTKVLAFFEMTLPEWLRLDRRFTREAEEDPALAAEIERRAAAAKVNPELLVEDPIGVAEEEEA